MYLEHINSGPADVKKLSLAEMTALCGEIRTALIESSAATAATAGRTSASSRRPSRCTAFSTPRKIRWCSTFRTRPIRTKC